jgi:hypothetical protein
VQAVAAGRAEMRSGGAGAAAGRPAPDDALLLECARRDLAPGAADRLAALLAGPMDWSRVMERATEHGVTPLLARHLGDHELVPEPVRGELARRFRRNTERNVALTGELLRLLDLLHARGVGALPFKGPTLAAAVYGHLGLREFGDLDLLVLPRDVPAAREVLMAEGYRPRFDLTRPQESLYLRSRYEHPFVRAADGVTVELQWRILPIEFGVRLDYAGFWGRSEEIAVAGRRVPALASEDLLLVLAVHGAKHLWERLAWITDVAELVRRQPGLHWDVVGAAAQASGSRRMLALALVLAADLFAAPVPPSVLQRARADSAMERLVETVRRRLIGGPLAPWQAGLFHVRVHERRAARCRYLFRLALGTTPGDWAVVRLPRPLFPLYRFVRVGRVAWKYGRQLTRSVVELAVR